MMLAPDYDPRDAAIQAKTPPHNIEAEQALLGAILVDNKAFERVQEIIVAADFFEPLHGRIFETMAARITTGFLVTPMLIKDAFKGATISDGHTVEQYLGRLASRGSTVRGAPDYAKTIIELAKRRMLISIGEDLSADAFEAATANASKDLIEEAEQKLFQIAEGGAAERGMVSFRDAAQRAVDYANKAYQTKGKSIGLKTGLIDLDDKLGGLRRSDLVILAGRPSMGKSALATNIGWNIARTETHDEEGQLYFPSVLMFSLEMGDDQLALRVLSSEAQVKSHEILRGRPSGRFDTPADYQRAEEKLAQCVGRLVQTQIDTAAVPFWIDARGGITFAQLASRARRAKRRHNIQLIIIDYLQLLTSKTRAENRVQELTQITTGLKALAKELDLPIVALSQLSRGVDSREDKRPHLADLRESGSIEQDADVVMFVYREEYYLKRAEPAEEELDALREWKGKMAAAKGKAEIIIGKQRHGPTGTVHLAFIEEHTQFANLAIDGGRP